METYLTKYTNEDEDYVVIKLTYGLVSTKIHLANKQYEKLVDLIKKVENLEKKDN